MSDLSYEMNGVRVLYGNALDVLKTLPEKSVQAALTSPPYFNMRRYEGVEPSVWGGDPECDHSWDDRSYVRKGPTNGTGETSLNAPNKVASLASANDVGYDKVTMQFAACTKCDAVLCCLGLEPEPGMFIDHLVMIFREVRRVLRDDGILFVNLGDSYAGSGAGNNTDKYGGLTKDNGGKPSRTDSFDVREKSLLMVPERFALAMARDGWVVRSKIIWGKKSALPESVQDRPVSAHEPVYMFAKNPKYYWNLDDTRERAINEGKLHLPSASPKARAGITDVNDLRTTIGLSSRTVMTIGRNLRNIWPDESDQRMYRLRPDLTDEEWEVLISFLEEVPEAGTDFWHLGPEPLREAHHAPFPSELPRRCVLAGTAEYACSACGKPYERIVSRREVDLGYRSPTNKHAEAPLTPVSQASVFRTGKLTVRDAGDWKQACVCEADPAPCTVLDPFGGSGTTGTVAIELGRRAILIDASPVYTDIMQRRLGEAAITGSPRKRLGYSSEETVKCRLKDDLDPEDRESVLSELTSIGVDVSTREFVSLFEVPPYLHSYFDPVE